MKKPSIPATGGLPAEVARVIEPLKANVEIITGARPGAHEILPLGSTASLADVIGKVNEIISRINRSG